MWKPKVTALCLIAMSMNQQKVSHKDWIILSTCQSNIFNNKTKKSTFFWTENTTSLYGRTGWK